MRTLKLSIAIIGILLLQATAAVRAQKPRRPIFIPPNDRNTRPVMPDGEAAEKMRIDPRYSYVGALVQRDDVRLELKMTDTQRTAIQPLVAEYRTFENHHINILACKQFVVDPQEASQAVGPDKPRKLPDGATIHYRQNIFSSGPPILISKDEPTAEEKAQIEQQLKQEDPTSKILAQLTPAQQQRLKELDLQWRGALAIESPQAADLLNLTAQQRQKVATAAEDLRNELWRSNRDLIKRQQSLSVVVGRPIEAESAKRLRNEQILMSNEWVYAYLKKRDEVESRTLELLTPTQRTQWQALLGAPFTFAKPPNPPAK